ncbi:DNA-directed RNA polymerase II subunit RPB1-like [Patiria miniata]|uniref:Uncharacterized protein n=1 Tax=Patiria miniata TaxID=46514 RepID=A0A913Z6M1_PATMI|nr:DNA-directed RNA polymerase II subunit RPB1-like [Patiria miniata]
MSSTWVPKPPRNAAAAGSGAAQWPKAVGSRPTQPRSTTTESLGAYTYFSQGNPGSYPHRPSQMVTSPTQPQHRPSTPTAYKPINPPSQPQHRPSTLTMYQPVTPPSSPPRPTGPSPVQSTKRVVQPQREIKSPTAGISSSSRVSPSSSTRPTSPRCICHRDHSKIMCYVCGKTQVGRVRMQCPEHPNTIHLMDYDRCPVCKAVNLAEMRPH